MRKPFPSSKYNVKHKKIIIIMITISKKNVKIKIPHPSSCVTEIRFKPLSIVKDTLNEVINIQILLVV